MKKLILLMFLITVLEVSAQNKQANMWYLGQNGGLSFNTIPPTPFYNGNIQTSESSSSICDSNGNVLLYTDGNTLWNGEDSIVENGNGTLYANQSSTQGVMLLTHPDNDSIFYVVTTAGGEWSYYSIVNIKANKNKGKIIKLNIPLQPDVDEKLAATLHGNGKDIWVVMHGANNDAFYFYLITKDGLIECPRIINIGLVHSFNFGNAPGGMKFSVDGKKLAVAGFFSNSVEVFSFDNTNCVLSHKIIIDNLNRSFGVEFSFNSKYLYITELSFIQPKRLLQYDLSSNNELMINNSQTLLLSVKSPNDIPSLQIAPDRKIYMIRAGSEYMTTIHSPDSGGIACDFQDSALKLPTGAYFAFGMPAYPSYYFHHPALNFEYDLNCSNHKAFFTAKDTFYATKYQWLIQHNLQYDTLYGKNTNYQFTDTGYYNVQLIAGNGNITDSVTKTIYITPNFSLGRDTILCNDTLYELYASKGVCYKWQDSSSGSTYDVKQTGTYYVSFYNNEMCQVTDTIYVELANSPTKPIISREHDTLFTTTANSYQWYKDGVKIMGANDSFYLVKQKGIYRVEVYNKAGCSNISDTFDFNLFSGIQLAIEPDVFVYPNPFNEFIVTETKDKIESITVLNSLGEILYIGMANATINSKLWANGLYILTFKTSKGHTKHFKLIKL